MIGTPPCARCGCRYWAHVQHGYDHPCINCLACPDYRPPPPVQLVPLVPVPARARWWRSRRRREIARRALSALAATGMMFCYIAGVQPARWQGIILAAAAALWAANPRLPPPLRPR
jgi:hypothetical protein